jgi:FMN phosphatase YigB (HAD superfamily)
MKYLFFDFDRTLFDTEAFYNTIERLVLQGDGVFHQIHSLESFLYPGTKDVLQSLVTKGHTLILVTYGLRAVQETKFLRCNIGHYFTETFYVEQGSKAKVIKDYCKQLPEPLPQENIIFIDDTISHLEFFKQKIPSARAFRMCRPGAKGNEIVDQRFKTIIDLREIETYLP